MLWKQYFSYSLRSFLKYLFSPLKTKLTSSHRPVIFLYGQYDLCYANTFNIYNKRFQISKFVRRKTAELRGHFVCPNPKLMTQVDTPKTIQETLNTIKHLQVCIVVLFSFRAFHLRQEMSFKRPSFEFSSFFYDICKCDT